jgi:hypothetical protein
MCGQLTAIYSSADEAARLWPIGYAFCKNSPMRYFHIFLLSRHFQIA